MRGTDAEHADDADRLRIAGMQRHGGMGPADAFAVFLSEDQAFRIEDRFSQDETFEEVVAGEPRSAAIDERLIPNSDKTRRVVVAKSAVLNHNASRGMDAQGRFRL